jgi:hypothetical protein
MGGVGGKRDVPLSQHTTCMRVLAASCWVQATVHAGLLMGPGGNTHGSVLMDESLYCVVLSTLCTWLQIGRLTDADIVALLLASPALRGELRLVRGIDSEPDTDGEGGGATDMDDSD